MLSRFRHPSPYLLLPGLLLLAVDAELAVYGCLHPSFNVVRITYSFNTLLMPCLFLAAALLGATAHWRAPAARRHGRAALGCLLLAAALAGVRVYATHIEPHRLQVRTVHLAVPALRQPLRILHISDIQSAGVGRYEERVFRRMRELQPDLVLHSGDLLHPLPPATIASETPRLAALFRTLQPPLGIYGVPGDVDEPLRRLPPEQLGGLRMLNDQNVELPFAGGRIRLLGLCRTTAASPVAARPLMAAWIRPAQPGDIQIVLGHSPDYAVAAQEFAADLCLAGHTHGGQIRLPFLGPLVTLTRYVPHAWTSGYRAIGLSHLNVSTGIGCEHAAGLPCIRFNCPPEMTLIILEPGS